MSRPPYVVRVRRMNFSLESSLYKEVRACLAQNKLRRKIHSTIIDGRARNEGAPTAASVHNDFLSYESAWILQCNSNSTWVPLVTAFEQAGSPLHECEPTTIKLSRNEARANSQDYAVIAPIRKLGGIEGLQRKDPRR